MTTKYKNLKPGCYLDHANYASDELSREIVKLALGLGFTLNAEDSARFENEPDCDDERANGPDIAYSEFLDELASEAETYLNEQESRPGLYWANEGEAGAFGLWVNVEAARESVEFVSGRKLEYPCPHFEGYWLHVNERGNATLYNRTASTTDRELWAIV